MALAKRVVDTAAKDAEPLLERVGISEKAFARIALNALLSNPGIASCDPTSLRQSLLACAERGVMPDGASAVIVPYRQRGGVLKARLDIMIGGLLDIARAALPGLSINAKCVYDGDVFEYVDGIDLELRHVPSPSADRSPEKIIAVYAVAHVPPAAGMPGPPPEVEVLFRPEIERRRAMSPSGAHGPWAHHFGEMAEKAVLRLLLKRLPVRGMRRSFMEDFEPPEELGAEDDPAAAEGGAPVQTQPAPVQQQPTVQQQPAPQAGQVQTQPPAAPAPQAADPQPQQAARAEPRAYGDGQPWQGEEPPAPEDAQQLMEEAGF